MRERRGLQLSVSEIRVIAEQMLVALNALKSREIVHTDVKLENIVLVNHQLQPFKVKLVDFGLAALRSEFPVGASFLGRAYRPPEVILGLPVDEGIDMWALGCVLVELFTGQYMFSASSNYEILRNIIQLQGTPLQNFIRNGFYAEKYFTPPQDSTGFGWQLKTPQEYYASVERQGWDCNISNLISSFDDMPRLHKMAENPEDILAFMDLLKKMLEIDPMIRITPVMLF
ncbi:homeodomain-interacting protein kinase 1-like isoform X3 [Melanotaenia boesemani]|uniref:homeodomain-interacting protein kinase 1-like isoform X3 n=1 Tax=Melanotaenia boesemani TaxID=1250792 RepID=UPI001C03DFED|nr:homeodomain-interacting protein kinase 1-like isoform X3 [Melanotaenia boesemani]